MLNGIIVNAKYGERPLLITHHTATSPVVSAFDWVSCV